jgi:hypothetical protein
MQRRDRQEGRGRQNEAAIVTCLPGQKAELELYQVYIMDTIQLRW